MRLEKRSSERVPCCALVYFGSRKRPGIVTDLSRTGMRLLTLLGNPPEENIEIWPCSQEGSAAGPYRARVVWIRRKPEEPHRECGVEFLEPATLIDELVAELSREMEPPRARLMITSG